MLAAVAAITLTGLGDVEVTYLTWTEDGLLRQVSYQAQREDKPARQVVRAAVH
jgi:hypothetical protein